MPQNWRKKVKVRQSRRVRNARLFFSKHIRDEQRGVEEDDFSVAIAFDVSAGFVDTIAYDSVITWVKKAAELGQKGPFALG